MPRIDMRPKHLEELKRLLCQHAPDAEVWAFGSRVNGTGHDASDLDLVLRNPGHPELPIRGIAQLREALSESDLPILVDVLDWARIPESFRREIEQSHCGISLE